jgi:hypothetical protein
VSGSSSRTFIDVADVRWTVRWVQPVSMSPTFDRIREMQARSTGRSEATRRMPWLIFESDGGERRRLAPVPDGWSTCPAVELERLCSRAEPVTELRARGAEGR